MHLVTERNRKWWVVIAMAITTLLMTIDFNGLTVAPPTIGRDLNTSTTGLQWTINAYLLALAAPSVAAGRLADIFGTGSGAPKRYCMPCRPRGAVFAGVIDRPCPFVTLRQIVLRTTHVSTRSPR
jgi:MFS family permease